MSKFYKIGDYTQKVGDDGKISCTCKWSSIYEENFRKGDKICKHIKKIIKLIKENENIKQI